MQIIEVTNKELINEFLDLPRKLYQNETNWISPLDSDIENVFDPKKNKLFSDGEAIRWILADKHDVVIGRVAAFINAKTTNKNNDQPTGGLGFFECIEDKQVAFLLFDTAKKWLDDRKMEAMDAPINFGDRNSWWGLLVDGFHEPSYLMPYNFPYYQRFFEEYGFQVYFKQFTYHRYLSDICLPSLHERSQKTFDDSNYTFRFLEKKHLKKYASDFRKIYNGGWGKHPGVSPMTEAQAQKLMNTFKPILDPQLMTFAYYKDEPVGCFLILPELNQIFKTFNGKFNTKNPIDLLKFLYHRKTGTSTRCVGVLFGIVEEHQGKGVESALSLAYYYSYYKNKNYPYNELQFNWIGDFNPKMMRVCEMVGGKIYKTHHTYRMLFDATKPFKRMPIIG